MKTRRSLHAPDYGALAVGVSAGLSSLTSDGSFSGVSDPSLSAAWGVLIFLLVRYLATNILVLVLAAGAIAVTASWFGVLSFSSFSENLQRFSLAGINDPVSLRALLMKPPPPFILGEWLTVLLLGLGFAAAVSAYLFGLRRKRWGWLWCPIPTLMVAVIFVACSRAAFGGVVVLLVGSIALMTAYGLLGLRGAARIMGGVFLVCGLLLFVENAFYPGVAGAYLHSQTSQERSTAGRIGIWRKSLELTLSHPLLGVGPGRAPILLTAEASADDTAGFASRTFSLPLQILTEQGIVGALAWMFLLSGVAWKLHRRLRDSSVDVAIRAMQATFGAGVAAVLVREFTYSSLFEHGVTLFLFLGMLALTCQDFDSTTPKARAEAPTAVRPGAKMMAEKKTKPRRKARV